MAQKPPQNCIISIMDYGAKMDGKSDDTNAIMTSLIELNYAYIPMSKNGAIVKKTIQLKPFQSIYGANRGSVIKSHVPSGDFTIVASDIGFLEDASVNNITIDIKSKGANGINILRSRNVFIDNICIKGNKNAAIGIQIDGGVEKGSAWNQIDKYTITRCEIGLQLTSNTPKNFCNRNYIGYGIIQSCNTGVRMFRANTNTLFANTQACPTGFLLEKSKSNRINTFIENSKIHSIKTIGNSNNNVITGGMNVKNIDDSSKKNQFNLTLAKQEEFNKQNEKE